MKFIHLSDLHLGKRVNEFSMIADQRYVLKQILEIINTERADGVLIAGDVYDKTVPVIEAVGLFDEFLVKLAELKIPAFIIGGNHDSPERLSFCNRLIDFSGIHIAPAYGGEVQKYTLEDEYGKVNVYLLPFIRPIHVRRYFPEENVETYTDALRTAISQIELNNADRNVLVTHQFVTGATRCESEEFTVGGTDNVDVSVFDGFDYVALGHLHGAQNIAGARVRYCGTPLKYSFSESRQEKSVTVAEFLEKGNFSIRTIPLKAERDMCEIRGTYEEVTSRSFYENTTYKTDYLHITLTDETEVPDAVAKLRTIYKNLMSLTYDNASMRLRMAVGVATDADTKTPVELFAEFYEKQNGMAMNAEQQAYVTRLLDQEEEE